MKEVSPQLGFTLAFNFFSCPCLLPNSSFFLSFRVRRNRRLMQDYGFSRGCPRTDNESNTFTNQDCGLRRAQSNRVGLFDLLCGCFLFMPKSVGEWQVATMFF